MWREIIRLRTLAVIVVLPLIAAGAALKAPGTPDPDATRDATNGVGEGGENRLDDVAAAPVRVYFNNFDAPAFVAGGVTGGVTLAGAAEAVQGYAGLGQVGNQFGGNFWRNTTTGNPAQRTRLILSGLPAHRSINLRFLLAIIDSWDGNSGPDYFNVAINGVVVFSKSFDSFTLSDQSYVPPPGGQLSWGTQRGFNGGGSYLDAAYDMTLDPTFVGIPHSASILAIDFFASGGGWQGGTDESWAIENLEVLISDVGPEPGLPFTDAISREVSVYMPDRPVSITDAVSREVSVLAYEGPHPAFTDAVSREVSVFAVAPQVELTDAISREVSVFSVLPITLGTPYDGVLAPGNYLFFRVTTPANLTMRIDLDHASTTAWTELYASFGHVPDTFNAEFSSESPGQPDQELVIPNTQAGTYYILARATTDSNASASKNFRLTAAALSFGLRSVKPDFIGAGVATIQINAARLTANTTFALLDPDTHQSYPPVRVQLLDAATALATFDMTGAPLKRFDVAAREPGLPDALLGAGLQVAPATDIRFLDVRMEMPSRIRGGRPADSTVYVTNTGNVDIPVVETVIFTSNDSRVDLSAPSIDGAVAQPGGAGANMGFSVLLSDLRPGETRQLGIRLTAHLDYPAQGSLGIAAGAVSYSATSFRDGPLARVSEATRLAVLQDPNAPIELRSLAADQQRWWQVVSDYFDEHGLAGLQQGTGASDGVASVAGAAFCGVACLWVCTAVGLATFSVGGIICAASCSVVCDQCTNHPRECAELIIYCTPAPLLPVNVLKCLEVIQAWDPNEKDTSAGFSDVRSVRSADPLEYKVSFENAAQATAPAAEIRVADQLDPSLDISTFRLRRVQFGDHRVDVPEGRSSIQTVVDLLSEAGVLVEITCGVDVASRTASCTLRALDPETRQLPADPALGFLPPNNVENCGDPPHCGEGFVEFTIKSNASTPTGIVVKNKASIVFDYNDPIETNEVSNTIDAAAPQSAVQALPAQRATPFVVRWAAQDDTGGSGVAAVDVFVKADAGPFELWISSTGDWDYFNGEVGKTYAFYAVGKDNVGNVEAAPATPDATTTVTAVRHPGDVDYDGDADLVDHQLFAQCFGAPPNTTLGGPDREVASICAEADLNLDGRVDLLDFAVLQNGFTATAPP